MDTFEEHLTIAAKKIQVADHLLTQTYPLIKDPKLLISIAETLHDATDAAVTGLLEHELLWKRIDPYEKVPKAKLAVFQKLITKYHLSPKHLDLACTLQDMVQEHKHAAVEFSRKGSYVISDDSYRMRTLSEGTLKDLLQKAKTCVDDITVAVKNNARITR